MGRLMFRVYDAQTLDGDVISFCVSALREISLREEIASGEILLKADRTKREQCAAIMNFNRITHIALKVELCEQLLKTTGYDLFNYTEVLEIEITSYANEFECLSALRRNEAGYAGDRQAKAKVNRIAEAGRVLRKKLYARDIITHLRYRDECDLTHNFAIV
ncbi:hypothetical protein SAMN04487897_109128 [Paenibacillus sp. yr247]|uniref:hypothetical protein n=1 Tax=Paenibacillus sp. yr247 TaxID=1761880 RepID=UPI000881D3C1|nr:hypothetical protein [Paenibacillus sp. yr247]SDO18172.1 hypothetical protein SAMN04487897_109128 [Paenibacillus sp. yr247]